MGNSNALRLKGVFDRVMAISQAAKKQAVKPYAEMKDEEIVSAVQNGEHAAFSHIINRYQGKIYSYIFRLTNHPEDANDITQEVFLKAYRHLHTVDTERKFSSWIYRIAHNESVNWLKKRTRTKVESLDAHMEQGIQIASSVDVANQYVQQEEQIEVRAAINKLPEKYRKVLELRYLHEYSYQEISKTLGKPINTVGTLINRAKKLMYEKIQSS